MVYDRSGTAMQELGNHIERDESIESGSAEGVADADDANANAAC